MSYNQRLKDCFFDPQHAGVPKNRDTFEVVCQNKSPDGVSLLEMTLQSNSQGVITQAMFRAKGNPYLIAGLEWICRQLEGEPVAVHPRIDLNSLMQAFDVPDLSYPSALRVIELYQEAVEALKKQIAKR